MWQDLEAVSRSQSSIDRHDLQEALCYANKVNLPSIGVNHVFSDEMHGGQSSNLRSIHLSQISVVASAEHLGAGLDASIIHELVENLSCLLMELASSAVTLNGRLDTSETLLVLMWVHPWIVLQLTSRTRCLYEFSQQAVNIRRPEEVTNLS